MYRSISTRTRATCRDRSDSRGGGFTLVELLVVIGIIALLIAVLLPALSKAREQSNRVKCLANLRSLGQGMYAYANTFRDRLPNGNSPGSADPDSGDQVLVPLCDDYAAPAVFHCPSDRDPAPRQITNDYVGLANSARTSYDFYSIYWIPEYGPLLARLRGQAPLAWDLHGGSSKPDEYQNHGTAGGNVLFSDGHVAWQHTEDWNATNWPAPASAYYDQIGGPVALQGP
jgi:prepilin-type N-terminal cleavage/methylation domain-containing protein/prepilin-type processing-associated H-X9-DG protein